MKKSKTIKFLSLIVFLLSFDNKVYAQCTEQQKEEYKTKANNVKITYQYVDDLVDANNEVVNGFFRVYFYNVVDDLMIYSPENNLVILPDGTDKIERFGFTSGTHTFEISSQNLECKTIYNTITITLPKYNPYSDSYLCNGIDSTKFLPCSKWYEYELDDETFLIRLEEYKNKSENKTIIEKAGDILQESKNNWYIYLIFGVVIVLIIILLFKIRSIFMKRKEEKKRW